MAERTNGIKDMLMPIMVVALIGASFLVGMLYGKVSVYENGQVAGTKAQVPGDPNAAPTPQEQAPIVLSGEQLEAVVAGASAVKGEENAPVTIVEFTDYQCPFCARYYEDAYQQIMTNYVDTGKVRYILRDLPLSFHPNAVNAAMAARCAGDQGRYWEMHDVLFDSQTEWSEESEPQSLFEGYAQNIGLNTGEFTTCYSSDKYADAINEDLNMATEVGASGTPTFYVNGTQLVGAQPYPAFEQAIEAEL